MKKNIAILAGGNSSEYEISMLSAQNVLINVDTDKFIPFLVELKEQYWNVLLDDEKIPVDIQSFSFTHKSKTIVFDFAFIAIHGTPGENGILQGYLELLNIPYSTCNVLSSALSFDKCACNQFLQSFGINIADFVIIEKEKSYNADAIIKHIGLPCFVKPADSGSSYGITKVKKLKDLKSALKKAFQESDKVMIEAFIDGMELSCSVLKTKKQKIILPIAEIRYEGEFFDYNAKYFSKKTQEIVPASIPDMLTDNIQTVSSRIYDLLNCKGIVRFDFIAKENLYFLEVNTVPGMTKMSILTNEIKATDWTFQDIITLIIEDCME